MKNIFNSIDIRFLIVTVISFGLSYCTMNGITQQYIHFNNMDNEMAFSAFTAMVGLIGLSGIKK